MMLFLEKYNNWYQEMIDIKKVLEEKKQKLTELVTESLALYEDNKVKITNLE